MSFEYVTVWGVLATSSSKDPVEAPSRVFMELLDPPVEGGSSVYPYQVNDDGLKSGVANDAGELMEEVQGARQVQLGGAEGALEMSYRDVPLVVRIMGPDVEMDITPAYRISVPAGQFQTGPERDQTAANRNLDDFLEFVTSAYLDTDSLLCFGFREKAVVSPEYYPSRAAIESGVPERLFWLNIFPPRVVDEIGRARISSAPAWRTRELDDGAVLLVSLDNPTDRRGKDHKAVAEHLGMDQFL